MGGKGKGDGRKARNVMERKGGVTRGGKGKVGKGRESRRGERTSEHSPSSKYVTTPLVVVGTSPGLTEPTQL